MTKKIFRSIIVVAMVVLFAGLFIASTFFYDYFNKSQVSQLKEELSLVATNVDKIGIEYFDNFNSPVFRFTLVDADGEVLYDSQVTSEDMENHLDREEIREAFESGHGSSARYSSTLTERTFYEATRLESGNVLRISVSQVTVGALILGMLPAVCAIVLISIAVALLLSHKMAKSIVKPLNELDLENPIENETYEELAPILTKLNKQHKQITPKYAEWAGSNSYSYVTSFYSYFFLIPFFLLVLKSVFKTDSKAVMALLSTLVFAVSLTCTLNNAAWNVYFRKNLSRYEAFSEAVKSSYFDTLEDGTTVFIPDYTGIHNDMSITKSFAAVYTDSDITFSNNSDEIDFASPVVFLKYYPETNTMTAGTLNSDFTSSDAFYIYGNNNKHIDSIISVK